MYVDARSVHSSFLAPALPWMSAIGTFAPLVMCNVSLLFLYFSLSLSLSLFMCLLLPAVPWETKWKTKDSSANQETHAMGHKVYGEINWITLARGLLQEMSLIKANQSVRQTLGSILPAVLLLGSSFFYFVSFSLFHSLTHWRIEGQNNQNCIRCLSVSLSLFSPGPQRTSPYSNGSQAIDSSWTVKEISRILSLLSFAGALNGNNNCSHAQGLNWQKEDGRKGEREEREREKK